VVYELEFNDGYYTTQQLVSILIDTKLVDAEGGVDKITAPAISVIGYDEYNNPLVDKIFIIDFNAYYSYGTVLKYTLYSPDDVTVTLTLTITVKPLSPNLTHDFAQDLSFGNERALKNQEAKEYSYIDSNNQIVNGSTTTYYDVEVNQNTSVSVELGENKLPVGNNFGSIITLTQLSDTNSLTVLDNKIKYNNLYAKIKGDHIFVFNLEYFDGILPNGDINKYSVIGFVRIFKKLTGTENFKDESNDERDNIYLNSLTLDISNIKSNNDDEVSTYTLAQPEWATIQGNILSIEAGYTSTTALEYTTNIVRQIYKGQVVETTLNSPIKFYRRFITNEQQLRAIDGSVENWYLISSFGLSAYASSFLQKFDGTLYGNNNTIRNLYIRIDNTRFDSTTSYGLVGYLGGTIKDLRIDGFEIQGDTQHEGAEVYAGIVAGSVLAGGVIDNVKVSNSNMPINRDNSSIGGISGYMDEKGNIAKSDYMGTIYGNGNMGGIVGKNKGQVSQSTNGARLTYYSTKTARSIGGIVGWNDGGTVSQCDNYGSIWSADGHKVDVEARIGGIIGDNTNGTFDEVGNIGGQNVEYTSSNGFLSIGTYDNSKYFFKHCGGRVGKQ